MNEEGAAQGEVANVRGCVAADNCVARTGNQALGALAGIGFIAVILLGPDYSESRTGWSGTVELDTMTRGVSASSFSANCIAATS